MSRDNFDNVVVCTKNPLHFLVCCCCLISLKSSFILVFIYCLEGQYTGELNSSLPPNSCLEVSSRAAYQFAFRHALANFPKQFPSAESLLPFLSVLHFVKWTKEVQIDRMSLLYMYTSSRSIDHNATQLLCHCRFRSVYHYPKQLYNI